MSSINILYVVIIIAVFILGVVFSSKIRTYLRILLNKAPLIRRYWAFSIPFMLIGMSSYFLIYRYSPPQFLSVNINALGDILTILLAVFVGYFAFLQVLEGRFEKIREQAHSYFKDKSYLRAKDYYRQALSIRAQDFPLLSELLEVLIINNDFSGFDEKIGQLEKMSIENREKVVCYYLRISKYLFKEELSSARTEIDDLLSFVGSNGDILRHRVWDFSDIVDSDTYKQLSGDPKVMLDNVIAHITRRMAEGKRKKFEEGDYTVKD